MSTSAWTRAVVGVAAATTLLLACAADPTPTPTPTPTVIGTPEPVPDEPTQEPVPDLPAPPELPDATDDPQDVLTDLVTPWAVAFLPGGAVLITLRDPAEVVLLTAEGDDTLVGPGADDLAASTVTDGEGGLLGIAVSPEFETDELVYLYRTTADGNEVVRARLDPWSAELGDLEPVVTGIPAASNHNGGRIAFGPDGMLHVTTGDAAVRPASQDPDSLAGKILRVTPDGAPASGNPTEGSPVWTTGHRNVQGIGWAGDGTMYASEFGQNTWDELNVISPGDNYGWPDVEGQGGGSQYVDPVVVWSPAEASPSGLAVTEDAVVVAALRGQRLLVVPVADGQVGEPSAILVEELGRLRDVVLGPDGALWVVTNNTDGRGSPRAGDDRLVRLLPP